MSVSIVVVEKIVALHVLDSEVTMQRASEWRSQWCDNVAVVSWLERDGVECVQLGRGGSGGLDGAD